MIDTSAVSGTHGGASFWLDVADRVIKFLALLVGAMWTWMHYVRSRTYSKKLALTLEAALFVKDGLYLEVNTGLENLGAARHPVQERGTSCAVMDDLSEVQLASEPAFATSHGSNPVSRSMTRRSSRSTHQAKIWSGLWSL